MTDKAHCNEGSPEKVPDEIENGFWDLIFHLCGDLEFNSNIPTTFLFILYTISLSFYLFNLGIKFSCPDKRSW